MRYANCSSAGGEMFPAVVDDAAVWPLLDRPPISAGFDLDGFARAGRGKPLGLDQVAVHAPVLAPGKVICLGLNYRGHVTETNRDLPTYPVLFTKFADSIIGPHDPIQAPPESEAIDFEAELAVVIGRPGRRVAARESLSLVAGYCVANDITMRDYQYKSHQWLQGKAWPRSTPLGPWIVTGDELDDARSLEIRLERNGVELQHSNTGCMIFDVPTTVATLSEFVNLEPGDVVLMGTPGGVGFRREPKVLVAPGDTLMVEIAGIGRIRNQVIAEHA